MLTVEITSIRSVEICKDSANDISIILISRNYRIEEFCVKITAFLQVSKDQIS